MILRDPTHRFEGELSPRTERIANSVSIIGQPIFVPIPAFALLCMLTDSAEEYLKIFGISLLFVVILPTAITYYFSIKQGRTDGDIPDRTKRYPPLIIGTASYAIGAAALYLAEAPRVITVLMACYAIVTFVMLLITTQWKISIHAVGVIGPTMALSYAFWPWGLLFILILPPIVWSRYVLRKHTPAQLVAGALVGFVITGIVFMLTL